MNEIDGTLALTYNKHYIGLRQGNRANNFVIFKAKKKFLRVEVRVADLDALREELKNADIEVIGHRQTLGNSSLHHKQRRNPGAQGTLKNIFLKAYKESME